MELTRAQCLAVWSLASEAPTEAEFELTPPDDKGTIIMTVKSWMAEHGVMYKLPRMGGREPVTPIKEVEIPADVLE